MLDAKLAKTDSSVWYAFRLLSPHVDALFDEQLLTFENDGRMCVHESLPQEVLERWSIDPNKRTEAFRPEQEAFLACHRKLFAEK